MRLRSVFSRPKIGAQPLLIPQANDDLLNASWLPQVIQQRLVQDEFFNCCLIDYANSRRMFPGVL
jgi:hypothetical protein